MPSAISRPCGSARPTAAGNGRWTAATASQHRAPPATRRRSAAAACKGSPSTVAAVRYRDGETAEGQSEDRTLAWRWHVAPDGARSFDVWLWDGRVMKPVMADRIAAP